MRCVPPGRVNVGSDSCIQYSTASDTRQVLSENSFGPESLSQQHWPPPFTCLVFAVVSTSGTKGAGRRVGTVSLPLPGERAEGEGGLPHAYSLPGFRAGEALPSLDCHFGLTPGDCSLSTENSSLSLGLSKQWKNWCSYSKLLNMQQGSDS